MNLELGEHLLWNCEMSASIMDENKECNVEEFWLTNKFIRIIYKKRKSLFSSEKIELKIDVVDVLYFENAPAIRMNYDDEDDNKCEINSSDGMFVISIFDAEVREIQFEFGKMIEIFKLAYNARNGEV